MHYWVCAESIRSMLHTHTHLSHPALLVSPPQLVFALDIPPDTFWLFLSFPAPPRRRKEGNQIEVLDMPEAFRHSSKVPKYSLRDNTYPSLVRRPTLARDISKDTNLP